MPSSRYNATRAALRPYGRTRGPAKAFATVLPLVRVTTEMHVEAVVAAEMLGVSVAEVVRIALSEFLAVPREAPTIDNHKEEIHDHSEV